MWLDNYYAFRSNLAHYGVKGMKWGVRRTPEELGHIKKKVTKSKNYDILDPASGAYFHLSEGETIKNRELFAGKGTRHPLNEEVRLGLSEQIGGKPENWQHWKGTGVIDYDGEDRKAEIHWFQEESVGQHKFKVKEWLD